MKAALTFLLTLATPAYAHACIGMFDTSTRPTDFLLWGLFASTVLLLVYDKALVDRPAMRHAIVASSLFAGLGIGFLVSTHPARLPPGAWGYLALFLLPLTISKYSTTRRRIGGLILGMTFSGMFSWFLFESNEVAHEKKHTYEGEFGRVEFSEQVTF